MPDRLSTRQELLQSTELQLIRLRYLRQELQNMRFEEGLGDEESGDPGGAGLGDSDHAMSVCSLSDNISMSSLSSLSSLSDFNSEMDSETRGISTDEDAHILQRMHNLIQLRNYLLQTRVLFPNIVHKVSQLSLVLEKFKADGSKWFRANLRVSPATFDKLLLWLQNDLVFLPTGTRPQLPVSYQLAITLFRFGHFGNAASVEAIAQWAGVSASSVV